MSDDKRKIESVNVDGESIVLTLRLPKDELLTYGSWYEYEAKDELKDTVKRIAQDYVMEHKEEILEKVLKDINWPDIVRSEIAQKVIREASRGF